METGTFEPKNKNEKIIYYIKTKTYAVTFYYHFGAYVQHHSPTTLERCDTPKSRLFDGVPSGYGSTEYEEVLKSKDINIEEWETEIGSAYLHKKEKEIFRLLELAFERKENKNKEPRFPIAISNMNLDDLLEQVAVLEDVDEKFPIKGWWAVANSDGIISYFGNEVDACMFRLAYINMILNS